MNQIDILKEDKNPQVLVVTPLLPGHKVSRDTKISIKRNETPFVWLTSQGNSNIPTNAQLGINRYKSNHKLPPYYLMIDRDIILGRGMIDRLVKKISTSTKPDVYAYASFEFRGYVNQKFPARPYDINMLTQHNYISSNSLFRMDILEEVGLVTDDKYKRLLDWAFLLKLHLNGYQGIPVPDAKFVAISTGTDISAGSPEDYQIKRDRVLEDFVMPIVEKFGKVQPQSHGGGQKMTATELDFTPELYKWWKNETFLKKNK